MSGRGDTAVYHFEQAIELDDAWPEGWMGLGETYQHLLPGKSPQDSLADAFRKVYQRTGGYAPALYHLTEFAIRDGDFETASELLGEYRVADPDPAISGILELALPCAEDGPAGIDWGGLVLTGAAGVMQVYQAGKLLAVGAARPECSMYLWRVRRDILMLETVERNGITWRDLYAEVTEQLGLEQVDWSTMELMDTVSVVRYLKHRRAVQERRGAAEDRLHALERDMEDIKRHLNFDPGEVPIPPYD